MKRVDAPALVNGVHIMEVQIELLNAPFKKLNAVYALAKIDEKENKIETHGRCTAYTPNWSEETMAKLDELLDSMERDLLTRHFDIKREDIAEDEDAEQV